MEEWYVRRFRAGVIAVISVVSLAACSGGSSGGSAAKEADPNETLTFIDSAPNPNLDPTDPLNDSSFSQATLFAVYDRLVGFDADGVPEPQLATEWSYSKDLKTVTLKLREGVTFHDGEPFNAAAVKANLERSKEVGDAAGATVKAAAAEVESVETPDDLTAVVHLNTPDGGFVYSLGTQIGMMLSPAVLDGSTGLDLKPVGAGPYKVDDFKPSDTTTFSRYDDYWDAK
jgi:peptide/nickel transport system substrate-binding protein